MKLVGLLVAGTESSNIGGSISYGSSCRSSGVRGSRRSSSVVVVVVVVEY